MQVHEDELQFFFTLSGEDVVFYCFLSKTGVFDHFPHVFSRDVLSNLIGRICLTGGELEHFHYQVAFLAIWYTLFQQFIEIT